MESVSIIVPVFNGETYLPACLDSILSQSLRDFRLYLVDDGSTDKTPEICRRYSARYGRITHIRQENRGVSAARNTGLALAKGEYVTFCDADDLWEETHLESLVRAMEKTGADMVSCNYSLVDEGGDFLSRTGFPVEVRELRTGAEKANYSWDVLNWRTGWAVWARLFRRDAVEKLRFFEDVSQGEDLFFVLEAVQFCRRTASVEGGCRYRQHGGSAMAAAGTEPSLAERAKGAFRLSRSCPQTEAEILWEILRPALEAVPARDLPGALRALPQYPWLRGLARRIPTPLARFCVHGNPLRYRMERKLDRRWFPGTPW